MHLVLMISSCGLHVRTCSVVSVCHKQIINQQGDVKCTEMLSVYETKLNCYFEVHVHPMNVSEIS